MIEHTRHQHYTDLVYCPVTHQWEGYTAHYGDDDPLMESCDGCQELFELSDLQSTDGMVSA